MIRAYIEKKNYTIYFRTCCVNSELKKILSFYSKTKIMFEISSFLSSNIIPWDHAMHIFF